ncbi:hypothetical protein GCM10010193_22870 [Kitasatospora atroaurantiaca]
MRDKLSIRHRMNGTLRLRIDDSRDTRSVRIALLSVRSHIPGTGASDGRIPRWEGVPGLCGASSGGCAERVSGAAHKP